MDMILAILFTSIGDHARFKRRTICDQLTTPSRQESNLLIPRNGAISTSYETTDTVGDTTQHQVIDLWTI